MIYDDKFLNDYATRIKKIYVSNIKKSNNFTLSFSLFCGLIAIIDTDIRNKIFSKIQLPKYINPNTNKLSDKDNKNKTISIMRHFRNSLCHFKIDGTQFISDNQKNIKAILFIDKDFYSNEKNFECCLSITEFNSFFNFILNTIVASGK